MSEETYYPKTSACLAIFTRVQLEAVAFAMTKALEGEMGDHRTPDEGAMQTLGRYLPEHLKTPMPTNFGDCLPKDATRIDAVPGGVGYEPTMKEALASLVERYKREIADDHLAKGYHAPVGLPEVRAKLAFAEDLLAELAR